MSGTAYVMFSSVVCVLRSALSIGVAFRERRRGSVDWAWLLRGTAGVLLAVGCVMRLVLAA
jgi:hypothetical protein